MAMRRRRTRTKSRSRTSWRDGRWTGDVFGINCTIANIPEDPCPPLLAGAPFRFPTTAAPCATQLFYPLLNMNDFGGGTGIGSDLQDRVTYKGSELFFTLSVNPDWVADAARVAVNGILEFSWRFGVFVCDDDEIFSLGLPTMFAEEWLTQERVLYTTGGYFNFIGGATVDNVATRSPRVRKPVRLTSGQGVYAVWEVGCFNVRADSGNSYLELLTGFGTGPLGLQGHHRTFYVT